MSFRRHFFCVPIVVMRFDVVVVLCPDRLARKYAYQVLLIEELKRVGVDVHFCERPVTDSPDDQLLLQIQGAIAEYERAKILERSRHRGYSTRARGYAVRVSAPAPPLFEVGSRLDCVLQALASSTLLDEDSLLHCGLDQLQLSLTPSSPRALATA